jgi:GTPase SAR1 family protein
VVIFLIGNKVDLSEERKVEKIEAEKKSKDQSIRFFEVSAKDANNVQPFFKQLSASLSA